MNLIRTNLSVHKTINHNAYLLKHNNNISLNDILLEVDKYEYPASKKDEFILFDIDTNEIIEKFENVKSLNIDKYSPRSLVLSAVIVIENINIKLPTSLQVLTIDGEGYIAELMSKTEDSSILWDKILYELQLTQFNTTLDERIESEKIIRKMYNFDLPDLKLESTILPFLSNIMKLNITVLGISNVYLTDKELDLISNLKYLETLELIYIINNSILKLPPKLKYLKLYGSLVEDLSEINLKGLNLETLELEGNAIKNIDGISKLKNLEVLNLAHNLIHYFDLNELPKNVVNLNLGRNIIQNDFFEGTNNRIVNKKIIHLNLSNNWLIVNPWLIYRITEIFPKLEYIDLSGNEADGLPEKFLVNDENNSCLEKIKFWKKTQDYKYTELYSDLKSSFNYYNNANSIEIRWEHDSLPTKLILADIQYRYNQFFSEMGPKFKLFREGIYCDISHKTISIIIREEGNSICLEFNSSDNRVLNDYFYKHFEEINKLVTLNTHHLILPVANFSQKSGIYEKFFKFLFKIDKQIKGKDILIASEIVPKLLVKFDKISKKPQYIEISTVVFVIVTGKDAFPFVIDENFSVCNIEEKHIKFKDYEYFNIPLRKSEDKKSYIDSLTNKYLGKFCFKEGVLYADRDSTQVISIFWNPFYFTIGENNDLIIDPKITINDQKFTRPKIKDRKLNLKIEFSDLVASYRLK